MTTEPTNAELAEALVLHAWDECSPYPPPETHLLLVVARRLRSDPPVDEPDLREAGDTQVRARALEEAAMVADRFAGETHYSDRKRLAEDIADAIRALSKEPS